MNLNRFNSYCAEDFVVDEIFCEIAGRGSLSIQSLKEQFPLKQQDIDLAVEMLHKLQNMEFHQSPEKKLEQWNQILRNQKKSVRLRFFKYAAAVLLIAGSSGVAFYHFSQLNSIEKFASSNEINYSDATLILVDGKQINISQKQANVTYSTDGAAVLVNDTAEMKQSVAEDGFNQMIVPFGKRSNLILSDGTKVWVNSGSRLVYAPVFKGKSREVFLEGEAYFEVAKDEKKPFFVRTNAFKVKVYGTKFDVQAYRQNNEYNTILIEGKVSLQGNNGGILSKEHFLFPDQKAMLSADKDDFLVTEVANIDNYTAWKDGYLVFKNEAFQSILKRVSHYYNIDIELNEEIQIRRLSGKLDLKDDPERVLEGLALISKIRYVKNVNKYRFYE
ncbi:MAG: FecR domain-containing protein [Prolixibacteraceae bacterium]|jgi:ferric-dicitrate binding protein FerR (iron transport regulator)|nr:FecR domain-containing protein [Prolixibacteraceae bacterium]